MNPILLSVVIPTYNHDKFLCHAIQSVLDQKYKNIEILVIDNFSCDNTKEVVLNFNDDRIRFLQIHNNGIIAKSRNVGIKEAKGNWIAFLDSDDIWYPTKINSILKFIKSNKYDVISTDEVMVNIDTRSKKILRYGPYVNNFYKNLLMYGNRLSTSATVVSKHFLNNNNLFFSENKNHISVEDYDLWMMMAYHNARFKFVRNIEGEYLIHGSNISQNRDLYISNLQSLLYNHVHNIQNFSEDKGKLWKKMSSRLLLSEAIYALRSKEIYSSFILFSKSFFTSFSGSLLYIYNKNVKK
jgi:glycosyltransferase involved in cell wall biosynthesis